MKSVFRYIREYVKDMDKRVLVATSLFTAVLVFLNYRYLLDDRMDSMGFASLLGARYIVFAVAFIGPYLMYALFTGRNHFNSPVFALLVLSAPLYFALKTAVKVGLPFTDDPAFWNKVVYWPFLLVMMLVLLGVTYKLTKQEGSFYGLTSSRVRWTPYIIMLLIMVPLVAAASTQPDFLHTYPKLQSLEGAARLADIPWWKKALFELSYGSDFLSIELFFRGFLIIGFLKWAGKDAILPMACFYCTIHFGKPLAECISSYFGGILLGILVYNTRSILGGLMVHLGIAWLMEIGGFIGNG